MPKTYPDIGTFTSGQILTAASMNQVGTNLDNFRVPPMASVYKTAAQSVANNTGVIVSWNTEYVDTDEMWDSGTSSVITAKTAGVYLLTVSINMTSNTSGLRRLNIQKNITGTTYDTAKRVWEWNDAPGAGGQWARTFSAFIDAAGNDTFAIGVVQNSTATLNVNPDATSIENTFSMTWLGQKA
jgi:hypothetical protein